jgi:hypothetical protein
MKPISRFVGVSVLALGLMGGAQSAHAISSYSVSDLSKVNQDMVNDLIGTAAVGTTHRAYMPASSMGWLIGLDMGIEATGVRLTQSFRDAIATVSQKSSSDIPSVIPVPKLNLHKGLPFGVDLGLSYIGYQSQIQVIGGDVKWAFTDLIKDLPLSGALRLNYTSEKLWYLNSSNFQTDLLVSKSLFFIEPYVGTGLQFWSGDINVPTGLPASSGLPANVSGHSSGTSAHFFAGAPLKLALFWLTPEVDYSTVGVTSFGAKFSFNF